MPNILPNPKLLNLNDIDSFGYDPSYDSSLKDFETVTLDDPSFHIMLESEFEQIACFYGADTPGDENGLEAYRRLKNHFVSLTSP